MVLIRKQIVLTEEDKKAAGKIRARACKSERQSILYRQAYDVVDLRQEGLGRYRNHRRID